MSLLCTDDRSNSPFLKLDIGIWWKQYLKHIAYSTALKGWRTVVVNHRGLGGVAITVSPCFLLSFDLLTKVLNFILSREIVFVKVTHVGRTFACL